MGCFSYMCLECNKPILSNSFRGQKVKLFHLQKGKIMQEMEGEYDSYGAVFADVNGGPIVWADDWGNMVGEHFNHDQSSGMAAIHSKCYQDPPDTISADDPDQGWGEDGELMGDIDINRDFE